MKSNYKFIRLIAFGLVLSMAIGWAGCTKNFQERNTSKSGLEKLEPSDIQAFFPTVVYNGLSLAYQTGQNLAAGMFSQFYSCTQVAFASHRYVMNQQWWASTWNGLFVNVMSPLKVIIDQTPEQPTMNAIARIWRVLIFQRYTDYFGPLPWTEMGNYVPGEGIPYDTQQDIYNALFNELSQAITQLQNNQSVPSFSADKDYIFHGNNAKWLKFANSLRLRMAMRISFVDPAKAKTEAEAAVAGGVMEVPGYTTNPNEPGDDAFMEAGTSHRNYLAYISAWNEFRMSANFESLFKGYNDPRMPKYFSPTVADPSIFRGGRAGLVPGEQANGDNRYDYLSDLGPYYRPDIAYTSPFNVMYAAESFFLRAEGVLNGWNMGGGSAEEYYNKGIEASMKSWNITDDVAITTYTNGTSLPVVPLITSEFPTPALTNIPVKFGSDEATQREQIGTQKWIALYPGDMEAWAEMRRTGYPRMYPLIHSDNADMPKDKMIRRIVFPDRAYQTNPNGVAQGTEMLGAGGDKVSTRLWWDVKPMDWM